jgi:hypothetical protein
LLEHIDESLVRGGVLLLGNHSAHTINATTTITTTATALTIVSPTFAARGSSPPALAPQRPTGDTSPA